MWSVQIAAVILLVLVFIVAVEHTMTLSPKQSKIVNEALKLYNHYVNQGTPHATARKHVIEDCTLSRAETVVLDSAIVYQGKGVVES